MALHTMQDHLQQTTVIAQRRSQRMLSEQSTSKAKDDAVYEAMKAFTEALERQEEVRRIFEQKCDEASVAETLFTGTRKDTLQKAEALERLVKTVTMREECLATRCCFLQAAPQPPGRSTEAPERALSAAEHRGHSSQSRTKSSLKQHSTPVHTTQLKVVSFFFRVLEQSA